MNPGRRSFEDEDASGPLLEEPLWAGPTRGPKSFAPNWAQSEQALKASGFVGPTLLPTVGPNIHLSFPFSPLEDFESEEREWER